MKNKINELIIWSIGVMNVLFGLIMVYASTLYLIVGNTHVTTLLKIAQSFSVIGLYPKSMLSFRLMMGIVLIVCGVLMILLTFSSKHKHKNKFPFGFGGIAILAAICFVVSFFYFMHLSLVIIELAFLIFIIVLAIISRRQKQEQHEM